MHTTQSKINFNIQTEAYQGPLELVLDLITARKLLINDLALTSITEDFIEHIRALDTFPVADTANFISLAATLLLIKSKSLIPDLSLTEEENSDIDDLKHRLEEYEKVRKASQELSRIFGQTVMLSAGEHITEPFFIPSNDISKNSLSKAFERIIMARAPTKNLPETRIKPLISIEKVMANLSKRIASTLTLSFKDLTGSTKEKVEVIVTFLALLELVKQGAVSAQQYEQHGNISITHTNPSIIPQY